MKSLLFVLALAATAAFARAGSDLVFESGFETPIVTHRTPKSEGGDVSKQGDNPAWRLFQDVPAAPKPGATGAAAQDNSLVGGVTNEIAHTGAQSLYIEATNLTIPSVAVTLTSRPIKIVPGQVYKVGIWGRNDVRHPMTADAQRMFLKLKVDFFDGDGSQTGDSQLLFMPLPGARGLQPLFVDTEWRQIAKTVTAPPEAQSMSVTWRWACSPGTRAENGVMYFDDANVTADHTPAPEEPAPTETQNK